MSLENRIVLIATALIIIACSSGAAETLEPPQVATASGSVLGTWVEDEPSIANFKGIPFAAPPVGKLRWKPPQPVEPWLEPLEATSFGSVCPQPDGIAKWIWMIATMLGGDPTVFTGLGPMSEDCLYLNVWTADLRPKTKRPVMVWIHGGGFRAGSASTFSTSWFDGNRLAERGAVVVTLNYRLGALGFLAHPALTAESPHISSGNYGLLDQIAVLEWVQRNIAAFGGDPGNVTIFGESAGGSSVVYLMTSPLAKGLFHRAIGQSFMEPYVHANKPTSAAFAGRLDLAAAEKLGMELAERAGAMPGPEMLPELRSLSAEKIVAASFIESQPWTNYYSPNVDGWVLPEPPRSVYREGRQHDVPFLLGVTADEGTVLLADPQWATVEEYRQFIEGEFGADAKALLELYSPSAAEQIRPVRLGWFQDGALTAARFLATTMEKVDSPAWLYVFSRTPPGPGGTMLGAFHVSEVQFIFDTHVPALWPTQPGDAELTDRMGTYWVQFALAGNPNTEGLPEWPPYEREADRYMNLDHETIDRTFQPELIERLTVLEELFWK